jgi:hypothetical protein
MRPMRTFAAAALVVVLAGCAGKAGGKYTRKNATEVSGAEARDRMVKELLGYIERKDDRGIAHMLASPLGYGGLWFPDTTCRRKFLGAGTIPEAGIDTLAACLVNLPLELSPRQHPYDDVAVFTYAPGIEFEALFDPAEGGHLVWLGFVSRKDMKDALPTVAPEALLALRHEVPPLVVDEATQRAIAEEMAGHTGATKDGPVYTWFKVCVDATGAVSGVHARVTSSVIAQDALEPWIRQWSFQPFKLGEQPSPVCSVVLVDLPEGSAKDAPRPLPVPPDHADKLLVTAGALGELLEGDQHVVPDPETMAKLAEAPNAKLVALALYCIDELGLVDTVVMMRSSTHERYDAKLDQALHRWRFAPLVRQGTPIRACSHQWLVYTQNS